MELADCICMKLDFDLVIVLDRRAWEGLSGVIPGSRQRDAKGSVLKCLCDRKPLRAENRHLWNPKKAFEDVACVWIMGNKMLCDKMTKKCKDTNVKRNWTRVFKISLLNATKNNLFQGK